MEYVHRIEIRRRLRTTLRSFLDQCPLLRERAGEARMDPTGYVASCFVAERRAGEDYRRWIWRQVMETLETELVGDQCGDAGEGGDSRMHQCVERVEFDTDDRAQIISLFAARPECRAMWERLKQQSRDAA